MNTEDADVDDDDILYGDLAESGRSADHEKLIGKIAALTKLNAALTAELNETKQQLLVLVDEKGVVENNMMILYNTAQREMSRKDKQIADLLTNERLGASTINTTVANIPRG
jgi:type IV secretory pathway VirB4 component